MQPKEWIVIVIYYRVALNQSCSLKEPRLAASSRRADAPPPFEGGTAQMNETSGHGPSGYNLYTKINAFFWNTLNKIE